jgi:hypothetical protein
MGVIMVASPFILFSFLRPSGHTCPALRSRLRHSLSRGLLIALRESATDLTRFCDFFVKARDDHAKYGPHSTENRNPMRALAAFSLGGCGRGGKDQANESH